eukprot:COSAG02_NODE_1832_length_10723_cov_13.708020_6_plen_66_part_00
MVAPLSAVMLLLAPVSFTLLQQLGDVPAPDFGRNFSFNASREANMNGDFVLSATPGSHMEDFPHS